MGLVRHVSTRFLMPFLQRIRTSDADRRQRLVRIAGSITALFMIVLPVIIQAQPLAGTYTVNAGAATGGTNFQTFAALSARLTADGVNGKVTINVVPGSGPYTENLVLKNINGTSASNTIRINGNGNTLQFGNSDAEDKRQMLIISNVKYLCVDNMVFKNLTATFGWGAVITGSSQYDSITNCHFDMRVITATMVAQSTGISISGAQNLPAIATAIGGSYCYIANNHIQGPLAGGGPYFGINIAGGGNVHNILVHNLIENYVNSGIHLRGNNSNNHYVAYNDMNRAAKNPPSPMSFYGIFTFNESMPGTKIIGNRIHDPVKAGATGTGLFNGMQLEGDGTAQDPVLIANNIIYNINQGNATGIFINGAEHNLIYHNTVAFNIAYTGSSQNIGWLIHTLSSTSNPGLKIKNNLVSITGGGAPEKFGFRYLTGVTWSESDGNNIYVNAPTGTLYYGSHGASNYTTRTAFRNIHPAYEANSKTEDPQFTDAGAGNLLPKNVALRESGLDLTAWVPEDITGQPRHTSPTPGAFEIPVITGQDASVISVLDPAGIFCAGSQQVRAVISNVGTARLSGIDVKWALNGTLQTPYTYAGLLDTPGGTQRTTDTVVIGSVAIPHGIHTIKVWTEVSNDQNTQNDTMTLSVSPTRFLISSQDTVCSGAPVELMQLSPSWGYQPGLLQWERSSNGTSFTAIANSDTVLFTDAGRSSDTWYRVKVNQGAGCWSDTVFVKISNASSSALITVNDSVCGSGSMTLQASTAAGDRTRWFSSASGGTILTTGNTYTTPVINTTTDYYAAVMTGSGGRVQTGPKSPADLSANRSFLHATATPTYKIKFTVHRATTLVSVDIFPDVTAVGAIAAIEIVDTNTKAVVHTERFQVKTGGSYTNGQTIVMNKWLPPGQYYIWINDPISLSRNNTTTANYPYSSPDLSITGYNNLADNYYHFFYNWQVGYGCTGPRQAVQAVVKTPPAINVTADPPAICLGDTSEISVTSSNNGYAYQWTPVGGTASAFSVSPAVNTKYVVTATDNSGGPNDGCWRKDSVTLPVHQLPTVSLTTSGPDSFCAGGSVMIMADSDPGNTYQWEADGVAVPPPAGQSATYTADTTGAYRVIVTNANQCSTVSDTIEVTSWPLPEPAITFNGTTMTTGIFDSYEWRRNGTVIPGATDQSYAPDTVSGDYSVTVTDGNGCTATSSVYPYVWTPEEPESITGMGSPEQVRVYPNPAADIVYIGAPVPVNVVVCSPEGKMVLQGRNVRQLSLNGLADGLYFIRVYKEDGVLIKTERLQRISK